MSCVSRDRTHVSEIVHDSSSCARQARNGRQNLNAINGELFAIKVALDIMHDDFMGSIGDVCITVRPHPVFRRADLLKDTIIYVTEL
jgi:hypothetical protein